MSPELKLDQVVKYLVRTGSITKVGQRYALNRRNVSLSGYPELAYATRLAGGSGITAHD